MSFNKYVTHICNAKLKIKQFFGIFLFLSLIYININYGIISPSKIQQVNPVDQELSKSYISNDFFLSENADNIPFNVTKNNNYFDGFNFFVLYRKNISNPLDTSSWFVIVDMNGEIINKIEIENGNWGMGGLVNSTTFLLHPRNGSIILWNYYTNNFEGYVNPSHHDASYNQATDTILGIGTKGVSNGSLTFHYDVLKEFEKDGDVIWSLDTSTFIPFSYWNGIEYYEGRADITHTNTVFWDINNETIYANMRNLNTFYKINHTSNDIIWGLGEFGDFTMYNLRGEIVENLFYHAHAVEKVDDNTFIIFDNDLLNTTQTDMSSECQSRIVEITIDESTMTANESWTWVAPRSYYSEYWGDADRLPNGNRFGTFGTTAHPDTNIAARLVEVSNEGDIVWEMNFPKDDFSYGVYKTERFQFSPIIEDIPNIIGTKNDDYNVIWKTWYNFRSKIEIIGTYEIYLNDSLIDSNSHIFDKFWRPTVISINLNYLDYGFYNLTLVLYDEGGHFTVDTINITKAPFYVSRNDLNYIEKGQSDSEIIWSGDTMSLLDYEIKSNESSIDANSWLGGNITLDGNLLTNGNHFIQFLLYNNSILVYNDSFWFPVYPPQDPLILSSPDDLIIPWNHNTVLSWSIFDYSPNYYEIYLDNTLIKSDLWVNQSQIIEWDLPLLTEGTYNLILIVYDQLLQSNSALTWITITPPIIPVIVYKSPYQIIWGENINLAWEVLGGETWTLYRNQSIYQLGLLSSNVIHVSIDNWQSNGWHPGVYNLTLKIEDSFGIENSLSILLEIILDYSDPYIDSFIEDQSVYYLNGENIIGSPDLNYTSIYSDYSNGYITGDMGEQEEILDGSGDDFEIIATSGEYQVWLSNNLSTSFIFLATANGNMSFDLATIGLSYARYIRIGYHTGGMVNVDAVVAINYNQIKVDSTPPEIKGPYDFSLFDDRISVILNWTVYDKTPFNYTISINYAIVETNYWNGSDIQYEFIIEKPGVLYITLTLFDVYGNFANDTVKIIIKSVSHIYIGAIITFSFTGIAFLMTLAATFIRFIIKKKKESIM